MEEVKNDQLTKQDRPERKENMTSCFGEHYSAYQSNQMNTCISKIFQDVSGRLQFRNHRSYIAHLTSFISVPGVQLSDIVRSTVLFEA